MCTATTNTVIQVRDKKAATIDVQNPTVLRTITKWPCFANVQISQWLDHDTQVEGQRTHGPNVLAWRKFLQITLVARGSVTKDWLLEIIISSKSFTHSGS
jgi:hypothetical protein